MSRHPLHFWLLLAVLLGAGRAVGWDAEWLDVRGRLVRLPLEDGWITCKSELAVVSENWTNVCYLSDAAALQSVMGASGAVWRADLQPEAGVTCQVTQVAHPCTNGVELAITAVAQRSNGCAGVYYILHVPAARFAGGSVVADGLVMRLPEWRARPYVIGYATGGVLEIRSPLDTSRIRLLTPTNALIQVQDNRRWSDEFALLVPLHAGALRPGQTVSATVAVTAAGRARTPPVEVQVETGRTGFRFEGFGGNYCYGMQGSLARAVRSSVRPSWARVQMRLDELPRPPSRRDPVPGFLRQLRAADKPGSELREGLEFQALLASNRTPFYVSLWRAPAWMYVDGEQHQADNVVVADQWPCLASAVAAYLRYARDRYSAEAEAFSLNEPDAGASIFIASNAYPAIVGLIGEELRRQGVRTRQLLGDVGNARDEARGYLGPACNDPAVLRQVSWLSFHAWGGATADEYGEWATLADRLRLPLVVAEAGVDPDWLRAPVQRHDYALAEMEQYFTLLRCARPQVVLLWEHSDDYPILQRDADGRLLSTARWGFQKQWCAFTPPGSLSVGCDVLTGERADACAFVHGPSGAGFTLHLGNRLAGRVCRIVGIPPGILTLYAIQTTRERHALYVGNVRPERGELRLELPAESMTTLSTLSPNPAP